MAKNLYELPAVTTAADANLVHVNQGGLSADKAITKANFLKEVNSSISSINSSLTNSLLVGTPYSDSVSLSTAGINAVDISIGNPATISGYTFLYWIIISTTYRFAPIGYGGTRLYYYVGTTSTSSGGIIAYPIYKKN